MSDDGQHGLTIIAFLGSVFSPYYAWSGRGDPIKAGQELLILEAMKMENVLRAERDGVVEEIRVTPGASVAADEVLIAFA